MITIAERAERAGRRARRVSPERVAMIVRASLQQVGDDTIPLRDLVRAVQRDGGCTLVEAYRAVADAVAPHAVDAA